MNGEKKKSVGPALRGVTFGYARKCRDPEWLRRLYSCGFDAAAAPESAKKKMLKMTKRSRYVIENTEKWPKNEPKTNPERTQFFAKRTPNEPTFWPNELILLPNEPNFRANGAISQAIQPLLEAREPNPQALVQIQTRSAEFGT